MSKLLVSGVLIAALACAVAAAAYPTLTGPTGTGVLPTAAVAPSGNIDLAADFYNNKSDTGTFGNTYPIRLLYGIGGMAEIGGLYDVRKDLNTWDANAKLATPVAVAGFKFALGAQYDQTAVKVDGLNGKSKSDQVSFEGTRTLLHGHGDSPRLAATIGVNWTRLDITNVAASVNGKESAVRGLISLEAGFSKVKLDLDYQTENGKLDTKALSSACIRFPIVRELQLQAGFANAAGAGLSGSNSYRVFAGINLGMGGK